MSVRPASASSRRRSTPSSWSPTRIRAPSRSATGRSIRASSTNVPWLEPASSIRTVPLPAEMRACVRETLGSSSRSVDAGARPITTSPISGTRSPLDEHELERRRRPPRSGRPQLPQNAAPRVTWRRQSGHSTADVLLDRQRLEDWVVAVELERLLVLLRVLRADADELAGLAGEAVIGLHDDELEPVRPPDRLARRHVLRLRVA